MPTRCNRDLFGYEVVADRQVAAAPPGHALPPAAQGAASGAPRGCRRRPLAGPGDPLSPWPPIVTLMHLAAFPDCRAARAVGLAPAREGEPGYWPRHDADNDGIACEPWPRR